MSHDHGLDWVSVARLWRACDHLLMSNILVPLDDDYSALITFIGRIGQQLLDLEKQVDDEELSNKLHDLAGQCIAEFLKGVVDGR
jgi:hypothetical protein